MDLKSGHGVAVCKDLSKRMSQSTRKLADAPAHIIIGGGAHGWRRRAVSPSCANEHSFQSCTNCLLHGTTCSAFAEKTEYQPGRAWPRTTSWTHPHTQRNCH